jgi:Predicted nucleotide-binding protein containing TIR-like domain
VTFPRDSLKASLKLAESIERNNAGKPFDRLTLASSINISPNSSSYRQLITSSGRYGLTEGGYQADKIGLTPLGSQIVAPTTENQTKSGLRTGLLTPPLFKRVYEFYDRKSIPREDLFKNTLRKEFDVATDDVSTCYSVLMQNAKDYSLIQAIKGTDYLKLDNLAEPSGDALKIGVAVEEGEEETQALPSGGQPETEVTPPTLKQVFVAHGKNKRPVEQLERILNRFKVPYKVAAEEPHRGRPVGKKVADLMKSCTSGIFIFTADEETSDAAGNKVYRPSDNVVFELGAASVLYGDKIVILKEEGVTFASDFSDIGYISFEKDHLDAKAADLMVELVSLGFLEVKPT